MAKKITNKDVMNNALTELNSFMKDFGINSIEFGKSHSIKKTKGKKAKSIIKRRK